MKQKAGNGERSTKHSRCQKARQTDAPDDLAVHAAFLNALENNFKYFDRRYVDRARVYIHHNSHANEHDQRKEYDLIPQLSDYFSFIHCLHSFRGRQMSRQGSASAIRGASRNAVIL